jgi:hypothetical protein
MNATALATAAAYEVTSRETHYPGMIEAGQIGRGEADADLEAWRAIAAIIKSDPGPDGEGWVRDPRILVGTELPWAAIEAAANRTHARLAARAAAAPDDRRYATRAANAAAILARLSEERWFWTGGKGPRPHHREAA